MVLDKITRITPIVTSRDASSTQRLLLVAVRRSVARRDPAHTTTSKSQNGMSTTRS
jgi:hypothetical protein